MTSENPKWANVVTEEEEQKKKEDQQKPLKVIEIVCQFLEKCSYCRDKVIVIQGIHQDKPELEYDPQRQKELVRFAEW
jgi:hypothetical protein